MLMPVRSARTDAGSYCLMPGLDQRVRDPDQGQRIPGRGDGQRVGMLPQTVFKLAQGPPPVRAGRGKDAVRRVPVEFPHAGSQAGSDPGLWSGRGHEESGRRIVLRRTLRGSAPCAARTRWRSSPSSTPSSGAGRPITGAWYRPGCSTAWTPTCGNCSTSGPLPQPPYLPLLRPPVDLVPLGGCALFPGPVLRSVRCAGHRSLGHGGTDPGAAIPYRGGEAVTRHRV